MAKTMIVPSEFVDEITKLNPKDPKAALARVVRRGITRVKVEDKITRRERAERKASAGKPKKFRSRG